MQKLKLLIVDDEPLAQEILQTYIAKIDVLELVGVCKNALEAYSAVNKGVVDLILLDINMPEITGIDFLKSLKNPPLVIFTTAYPQFAIESYELNAIDYLLKPIPFDRFLKAMNKAQQFLMPSQSSMPPAEIKTPADTILFVRSEGKWVKINLAEVWFVEGLKDYVRLWMNNGRIAVHSTMKNFEQQLSAHAQFVRVHKSHIVNLNFITEVDGNSIRIKDQLIAIGSTYKEDVAKKLDSYKLL